MDESLHRNRGPVDEMESGCIHFKREIFQQYDEYYHLMLQKLCRTYWFHDAAIIVTTILLFAVIAVALQLVNPEVGFASEGFCSSQSEL